MNLNLKKQYKDLLNIKTGWGKAYFAFLSGFLMFMSFPPFEIHLLAWVSLIPLLFVIKNSTSSKETFLFSGLTGIVFFSLLLYWLNNVTVPGTIALMLIMTMYFAIFGLIAGYVFKYSMDFLIIPFIWVIMEYLRGHVFSGLPWGLLGYSQYKVLKIIQISDITGAYGVSFIIVAFNVALFAWLIKSKRKIAYMMIALFFLILSTSYGMYRMDNYRMSTGPKISVLQGNIPQLMKWDAGFSRHIVNEYTKLTEEAAKDKPDLIIWPETSYPYLIEPKNKDNVVDLSSLAEKEGVPLLVGTVYGTMEKYYNSAMLFDSTGKVIDVYKKVHLVPFGEFIPLMKYMSFLKDFIDKPIGSFFRGEEYTLFSVKTQKNTIFNDVRTRQTAFYKFGVLICFEDVFPYVTREFVKNGADFIVNITNDAWFGNTAEPRQHLQSSVFRAVENRRAIVRAANTGISCFIDFNGKIGSVLSEGGKELFVKGVDTERIDIYQGYSFYTLYGDIFVMFSAIMIILLFITESILKPDSQ